MENVPAGKEFHPAQCLNAASGMICLNVHIAVSVHILITGMNLKRRTLYHSKINLHGFITRFFGHISPRTDNHPYPAILLKRGDNEKFYTDSFGTSDHSGNIS